MNRSTPPSDPQQPFLPTGQCRRHLCARCRQELEAPCKERINQAEAQGLLAGLPFVFAASAALVILMGYHNDNLALKFGISLPLLALGLAGILHGIKKYGGRMGQAEREMRQAKAAAEAAKPICPQPKAVSAVPAAEGEAELKRRCRPCPRQANASGTPAGRAKRNCPSPSRRRWTRSSWPPSS